MVDLWVSLAGMAYFGVLVTIVGFPFFEAKH